MERLFQFRDEYFKTHDISEAAQKPERVQQEINDAVKLIESLKGKEWSVEEKIVACGFLALSLLSLVQETDLQ